MMNYINVRPKADE